MAAMRNEQGTAGAERRTAEKSLHADGKKILPYIDFEKAKQTNLNTISTRMKRLLSERHPHELQHTFVSRCKELVQKGNYEKIIASKQLFSMR